MILSSDFFLSKVREMFDRKKSLNSIADPIIFITENNCFDSLHIL